MNTMLTNTVGRISRASSLFVLSRHSSTISHTLKVKQKIKDSREAALLGGGQKRIDNQHKKVCCSVYVVHPISVLTLVKVA
jgi:hypothetical protein